MNSICGLKVNWPFGLFLFFCFFSNQYKQHHIYNISMHSIYADLFGAWVSLEAFLTEMIQDWELYRDHQDVDPEVVRKSTEVAQGMVAWMRKMDLSPREPIATDESSEAHDCEEKPTTDSPLSKYDHIY